MKTILIISILTLLSITGHCQKTDKEIIKKVAQNIMGNTTWDFISKNTGKTIKTVDDSNDPSSVKIRSPYNTWHYWNGVLNIAMLDFAGYFQEPAYKKWVQKNYEFAFENVDVFAKNYRPSMNKWTYPFGQHIVTRELDDCGAMGGGLIEVYREIKRDDYKAYIDKAANHIMNIQERLEDGTLARGGPRKYTIWADDLYMGIVFLARMGALTGEQKYFDDAAKQVINFTKYCYNPSTELYYHGYYNDLEKNNVAHWGRCNGWVMLAQANLLEFLPENHPKREELLEIFFQQVIGVSRYQDKSGLWHQLINKPGSYLETSCTAMFTYSVAKAVNNGWIPKSYGLVALDGWEGLKSKITGDGQVEGICIGTGMQDNLKFYYNRPTQLNDIHGLGAVLLAGIEILKMKDNSY